MAPILQSIQILSLNALKNKLIHSHPVPCYLLCLLGIQNQNEG